MHDGALDLQRDSALLGARGAEAIHRRRVAERVPSLIAQREPATRSGDRVSDARVVTPAMGAPAMRESRRIERQQVLVMGHRVAALMRERGVSVTALAATVRVQRGTLQNLCSGQRRIPGDVLESIARALGTSVAYLKASTDDPLSPPDVRPA